ncbi:MAG: hypothetical protein CMJ64_16345 [Planctomycetaceae bacterium]|nr:hypothetical protein [Planctomycetaceae bacterium]
MSKATGMTSREKILAGIVVAALLIVGGIFTIGRVTASFDDKKDELVQLEGTIGKQETAIKRGNKAERQIAGWRERSLPDAPMRARSLYLDWLRRRAVDVKLDGVKMDTPSLNREGDAYVRHGFGLGARGTLQQLIQFLYDFYSVDQLHRITRLTAKPINNSKQLNIKIGIEAIAIPGAPDREALPEPERSDRLARKDVQEYVQTIMNRSLFSPANQPPKVEFVATQRANPNKEFRVSIPAKDPESDGLSFELEGDVPEGLRLDDRGDVIWTPSDDNLREEEYVVPYRVTDKGWPPKSVTGSLKIAVVVARAETPEDPGFDPATLATVSGITRSSLGPVVWINIKTEGKVLRLRAGDALSVGTIQGKVSKVVVGDKFAQFELSDGRVINVSLGRSLVGSGSTDLGGI